jgi:hypothetical protein
VNHRETYVPQLYPCKEGNPGKEPIVVSWQDHQHACEGIGYDQEIREDTLEIGHHDCGVVELNELTFRAIGSDVGFRVAPCLLCRCIPLVYRSYLGSPN